MVPQRWEPLEWSLGVRPPTGRTRRSGAFRSLSRTRSPSLDFKLVAFDAAPPSGVSGHASLTGVISLPAFLVLPARLGSVPADMSGPISTRRSRSPKSSTRCPRPAVPSGPRALDRGRSSRVRRVACRNPGDTYDYFVPYDGRKRPIPGVWISGSTGVAADQPDEWSRPRPAQRRVHRLPPHTSFNIVGDLPGADDEVVIVASHHDGPWASAVEDGSGISLVLAQAHYWSRRPRAERPHRLRLHPAGRPHGCRRRHGRPMWKTHRKELRNVVLEVHLEHAALEAEEGSDGKLVTDRPSPYPGGSSRAVASRTRNEPCPARSPASGSPGRW